MYILWAASECVCGCEQELELVEDVWRGEAQDLLSQIAQLQEENKSLLNNLSVKECPMTEEDIQKQEGSLKAQGLEKESFVSALHCLENNIPQCTTLQFHDLPFLIKWNRPITLFDSQNNIFTQNWFKNVWGYTGFRQDLKCLNSLFHKLRL